MRHDQPEAGDGKGTVRREFRVSRAFVELADTLVADYDMIDLLDRLIAHSVELLDVDAAGIMLADGQGRLRTVVSSGQDAELMEALQLEAGEGPCVDCAHSATPVSVADLTTTTQWPAFVAAARRRGSFRSVHAIPLRLRAEGIGAMNLLRRRPGVLSEDDLVLGQALADVATIGILAERAVRRGEVVAEQLQTALTNRVVIEQAKGVLAEQTGITVDAAFDRLRRYARSNNMRLSVIARRVVDGGLDLAQLPDAAEPAG